MRRFRREPRRPPDFVGIGTWLRRGSPRRFWGLAVLRPVARCGLCRRELREVGVSNRGGLERRERSEGNKCFQGSVEGSSVLVGATEISDQAEDAINALLPAIVFKFEPAQLERLVTLFPTIAADAWGQI